MAKYKVLKDTFFQGQLYEAGKVVAFGDDVKVSRHFAPYGSQAAVELEAKEVAEAKKAAATPKTMHEAAQGRANVSKPSTRKKAVEVVEPVVEASEVTAADLEAVEGEI